MGLAILHNEKGKAATLEEAKLLGEKLELLKITVAPKVQAAATSYQISQTYPDS